MSDNVKAFDTPLTAEEVAGVDRAKIDALVTHLWQASEPFQKTGKCLMDVEWLVALRRLYEAVATGNPQFGGWPSPEYVRLTENQLVEPVSPEVTDESAAAPETVAETTPAPDTATETGQADA